MAKKDPYKYVGDFSSLVFELLGTTKVGTDGNIKIKCINPSHQDTQASFSIRPDTAVYHCFGCGIAGNILPLIKQVRGYSDDEARRYLNDFYHISDTSEKIARFDIKKEEKKEVVEHFVPEEYVTQCVNNIATSPLKARMVKEWGITQDVLDTFEIGVDTSQNRVTIPVRDAEGRCVNVRKYQFDSGGDFKVISYSDPKLEKYSFGVGRIWPLNVLSKNDTIWFCEGEKDCLAALSKGLPAITGTVGANAFKNEWIPLFKGKTVYIVYDNDDAGRAGSAKIMDSINRVALEVRNVKVPVKEDKEDVTDFFIKYKGTVEDLMRAVLEATPKVAITPKNVDIAQPIKVRLADASRAEYFNKAIEIECTVIGKGEQPFMPPKRIEVSCDRNSKKCNFCKVKTDAINDVYVVEYPATDGKILNLIDCTEAQLAGWVKRDISIPDNCRMSLRVLETFNIEQILITPRLDLNELNFTHVNTSAFYIGHGLESNKTYTMRGYTCAEPKRNYATHIILEAIPEQAALDTFGITVGEARELDIFKAAADPDDMMSTKSIESKFSDIITMLTNNVTRIYGRSYLHEAIDLVYHTPLSFALGNEHKEKGWGDILVLGDTRTGKGEVVKNMMNYYGLGRWVGSENASYAGLIGGVDPNSNTIKWGVIPLNDRRLVIIDEFSGMPIQDISKLSGVRDAGRCDIIKISTSSTTGRSRLICLSNPREQTVVREKGHGIEHLSSLVGHQEDISRFDFALLLSNEDVGSDIINVMHDEVSDVKYTPEACKRLITWAWTRKKHEIIIDRSAIEACLRFAGMLSKKYSANAHLVQISDMRFKVAKLGIAYAMRTFNTYNDRDVIVEPRHMAAAYKFFVKIYELPACGYGAFSNYEARNDKMKDIPAVREFMEQLRKNDRLENFLDKMLSPENDIIYEKDLALITGSDSGFEFSKSNSMDLFYNGNCLKKNPRGTGYKKTRAFIRWLEGYESEVNNDFSEIGLD